ncbi:MAG: VacB/RNase II family 3'-5' exoribonuclease [Sphingomonadales bacterium]|nr:MAG: VacB/RNase II family 3'-5' exoribonuclease [Sphingomonadales bacterium]
MTRKRGQGRPDTAASADGLPDREQIRRFIETAPATVGKRDIAKAFGVRDRGALRALLKDMEADGALQRGPARSYGVVGSLPRVGVLKVVEVRSDGDVYAEPEQWAGPDRPPRIRVSEGRPHPGQKHRPRTAALGLGDRFMARIDGQPGRARAQVLKRLERVAELVLGVVKAEGAYFRLIPTDKRLRMEFNIPEDMLGDARVGELVSAEPMARHRALGLQNVRVLERLGDPFGPRALSLIAISQHGLPARFDDAALAEAARAATRPLGARADLTAMPFVAIDPLDARDHDDAIWAEPVEGGGWRIAVAIADVSYYVRPGDAIDREARRRGNSAYFPDRVVPMLPEALSADACSLKAGTDKAALVCHMSVGPRGAVTGFRFERARIRLAANIAYENAQAAIDAQAGDALPLLDPLWGAWRALDAARQRREPLDLDLPEKRIELDADGRVVGVRRRERLDAHRVVEDFMIAANVSAAKALEQAAFPCVYRIHEAPPREKVMALKTYLESLGVPLALGQVLRPALFNDILRRTAGSQSVEEISEQILRTQTQAVYSVDNVGHFGLALASYAHFTSPIRRYADLLVHRALVRALDLGEGGLGDQDLRSLGATADHISMTERRAMMAERDTIDRYVAQYLSGRIGAVMPGRVTGATRFGLFVALVESGGDGLVPISTLGDERFHVDDATQSLEGASTGVRYTVGMRLDVRLVDADVLTGTLRLALADRPEPAFAQRPPRLLHRRGRR